MGYCGRDGVLTDPNSLIYMRAHYYSSVIRRFINEDIIVGDIANSNSLNRYTYVEGNPVTMVDPFGLCTDKSNVYSNSELKIELVWKAAVKKNIVSGLKDFVNGKGYGNNEKKLIINQNQYDALKIKGLFINSKGANIKYEYENRRMEEAKLFNTK